MGIQGLLPLLKSIMVPIHIKELEGCCVAVDTYSWLHKGALSCSTQLCKGEPTSRHIDYCMHRVNLLRHYGVKPVLVFDGGLLPMKGEQENKRARARKENMARGIEHETNGNSTAAYECYQKAVDISPSIAYELIKVLKQENVYYVVAPYEADAQMTFLAVSKQVEAVITEDSDLIPFGCSRIIFKMDKFGQGVEFRNSMLQQNKDLSFMGFSMQMILEMCILSGCDYLPSIPGMGLKKAHALIKKFNSYDKVIKHLRYSIATVPPLYEESFKKAIWTFKHQRVYDPINLDIVYLSDPPDNVGDDLDFLGPSMPQHIAKGIAIGDLDPFTKLPFQGENVSARPVLDGTYQLKSLKSGIKKLDLPAQKNLMTNYFCFASLEAKRKFRAPRTAPNHLNPIGGSSPSPEEYVTDEVAACKINCSQKSLSDPQNLGIVHHKESVEDGVFPTEFLESPSHGGSDDVKGTVGDTRNPEHALLHRSSRSIHKPWLSLHKERGCKDTSVAAEGQTKIEKRKIIVRSSYFQNKVNKENDYSSKNEALLVKDDVAVIACEKDNGVTAKSTEFLESPSHGLDDLKDMVGDTRNPEDALLQQSIHLSHNPSLALLKERECKDASAAVEGKTVIEKRKVTVRSCYFQRKEVKEKGCDSTNVLSVKDGVFTDTRENTISESHFGEGYFRGTLMKRKVSPVDDVQTENVNPKYKRANVSITNKSNLASNLDETFVGAETDEEKFGCNISHLNQYTKIAEKSMERFVSVISSFRCSSSKSGSRASGLRAPLKDVCNTRTNRSTVSMDLSKFAYVPKNGKSSLASRRV